MPGSVAAEEESLPTLAHQPLHGFVRAIFAAVGSEDREATLIADHLVEANLVGHDSHGVGMIPLYLYFAAAGQVVPNRHASVVRSTGPVMVVDGMRGFGQVIAYEAMDLAIENARRHGISLTALRNSFHIGRIGHWAEQCARAGLASLHFVNVVGHGPLVAPFAGRDARFSTNPVCIGVPGPDGAFCLLDMATSKIALGKARVALNADMEAPPDALLDETGEPTRDPAVMFPPDPAVLLPEPRGALVAMGEHKGSGLAIMAELLAGALGGSSTMQPNNPRPGGPVNGMLSIVIDPEALGTASYLVEEGRLFLDYVKASPPQDPDGEVLTPGEPERRRREVRVENGIPVAEGAWSGLVAAAAEVGVSPPPGVVREP